MADHHHFPGYGGGGGCCAVPHHNNDDGPPPSATHRPTRGVSVGLLGPPQPDPATRAVSYGSVDSMDMTFDDDQANAFAQDFAVKTSSRHDPIKPSKKNVLFRTLSSMMGYATPQEAMENNPFKILKPIADYLAASTGIPQLVMWSFLAWFLSTISLVRPLAKKPFTDACVIMTLIGLVLNANAFVAYKHSTLSCPANIITPTLKTYFQSQPYSIARLFAIPYCVSCYSGVVNSAAPGTFSSIVPVDPQVVIPVVFTTLLFPIALRFLGDTLNGLVYPYDSPERRDTRRRRTISLFAE